MKFESMKQNGKRAETMLKKEMGKNSFEM